MQGHVGVRIATGRIWYGKSEKKPQSTTTEGHDIKVN